MNGYKQADAIDKQILQLINMNPLTVANSIEWLNFTRTIITGLDLIREDAAATLKKSIQKCPTCGNIGGTDETID